MAAPEVAAARREARTGEGEPAGVGPVVVIDYHKGNLRSMARGLQAAGADVTVSDDPAVIASARGLVLPGVGAFADAMEFMASSGQREAILGALRAGVPFLGVCLGAQLLLARGSEGAEAYGRQWTEGLGVIDGQVTRMRAGQGAKVPHVGWDTVELTDAGRDNPLFRGIRDGEYFYFTHSYVCHPADAGVVSATTTHADAFASALWDGGVAFGVQFHPEKSSEAGAALLRNFVGVVAARRPAGGKR